MRTFQSILDEIRSNAISERDKGDRFERLMQRYLQTEPIYANDIDIVWLWNEFPYRDQLGLIDTGIDLVARTIEGKYWAIQCKCYAKDKLIDKPEVDTFLSTSGKKFKDDKNVWVEFSYRLWIDTTERGFNANAEMAIHNQTPQLNRIGLYMLENSKVDWDKVYQGEQGKRAKKSPKIPKPHQLEAMAKAHEYFKDHDRGKLIMACGTGKTYTSLQIAEQETEGKGLILFLVPSIALLGQTMREWANDAKNPLCAICVCSDAEASRTQKNDGISIEDLPMPATTDVSKVSMRLQFELCGKRDRMTVVFSTYQSIDVVSQAQQRAMQILGDKVVFDMVICDEAHRTTGVTLSGNDDSAFVKVHDNDIIHAKKRMYMTATPRIYSESAQQKARESDAVVCSMDDASVYGDEFYRIGFGKAVDQHLLSDYKVLVLTLSEDQMTPALQRSLQNQNMEIETSDAVKMIGCINALSKRTLLDNNLLKESDPGPMRRAVAFCQKIDISKQTAVEMNGCGNAYEEQLSEEEKQEIVKVEAKHVDGSMGASKRDQKLMWLKTAPNEGNACRVLCNVRCLSEGVDVPSLDAILFLSARNSQVDVVQSVGRVMRKSEGKKFGYIIIPVVIPSGIPADEALNDNKRFQVVWSVLNALRAHDDRFDATINKLELNKKKPNNILVGGTLFGGGGNSNEGGDENGTGVDNKGVTPEVSALQTKLELEFEKLQGTVYARMVQKVGSKRYWEQWAQDVAKIAERHIEQITELINTNEKARKEFDSFLRRLHKDINAAVTEQSAIEMLAQHIITEPVFEALFENYSFAKNNAVSKAMKRVVDLLNEKIDEKDKESLDRFYRSVKMRAEGIDNAMAKQKIVVELYDTFFKTAFPKVVEKLGIVYTPVDVVDFIVNSVEEVLQKEFGRSMNDKNVRIIDPFTGTGTFITRLLQSGIIEKDHLEYKYKHEIFANEIVLLAYYIASINIENVYHEEVGMETYTPFEGICLTDTFQLGEQMYDKSDKKRYGEQLEEEGMEASFVENTKRIKRQMDSPITVIMGNPPYSVGQKSANDNAQNQKYPKLEKRIEETYVANTDVTLCKALYDSYIKAFRWASDRLDKQNGGIIGFITNSGWLDSNSGVGFRRCLEKEFNEIYIYNLRGNIRANMGNKQKVKKEGGNIFDILTGVAITILVKNGKQNKGNIHYCDIGDCLSRSDKLLEIKNKNSVTKIEFKKIIPNEYGDWINKRNDSFEKFISMDSISNSKKKVTGFFVLNSCGVLTSRDAWCYNLSRNGLISNIKTTISFYNDEVIRFKEDPNTLEIYDNSKFSWDEINKKDVRRGVEYKYDEENVVICNYRPFFKQCLYYCKQLNSRLYKMPKIFPNNKLSNKMICISVAKNFTCLMVDCLTDYHSVGDTQSFPLYYYENKNNIQGNLFEDSKDEYIRHDGITDFILNEAQFLYGKKVNKEDIFYYVYGFLHGKEYRNTFEVNLLKGMPRIPLVDKAEDFWAFSKAGRDLAEIHLNYEKVAPYEGCSVRYKSEGNVNYRVEKMKFVKKGDKSKIVYNNDIVIENIPERAYEYEINGKSAIEWIMERYCVSTDKKSGITNDANDWALEVGDERYILDLLLRIINVSLQTLDIVEGLPKLKFD